MPKLHRPCLCRVAQELEPFNFVVNEVPHTCTHAHNRNDFYMKLKKPALKKPHFWDDVFAERGNVMAAETNIRPKATFIYNFRSVIKQLPVSDVSFVVNSVSKLMSG